MEGVPNFLIPPSALCRSAGIADVQAFGSGCSAYKPRCIEVHVSPKAFGKSQVVKTEALAGVEVARITIWVI